MTFLWANFNARNIILSLSALFPVFICGWGSSDYSNQHRYKLDVCGQKWTKYMQIKNRKWEIRSVIPILFLLGKNYQMLNSKISLVRPLSFKEAFFVTRLSIIYVSWLINFNKELLKFDIRFTQLWISEKKILFGYQTICIKIFKRVWINQCWSTSKNLHSSALYRHWMAFRRRINCNGWWGWMALVWFGLVWFYGISTIVGYLMSNPFLFI